MAGNGRGFHRSIPTYRTYYLLKDSLREQEIGGIRISNKLYG